MQQINDLERIRFTTVHGTFVKVLPSGRVAIRHSGTLIAVVEPDLVRPAGQPSAIGEMFDALSSALNPNPNPEPATQS